MIVALLHDAPVPTSRLIDTLYGARSDGGPDDAGMAVRLHVMKMRSKLAEIGVEIETVGSHGRGSLGYRVKPEHVGLLRSALALSET